MECRSGLPRHSRSTPFAEKQWVCSCRLGQERSDPDVSNGIPPAWGRPAARCIGVALSGMEQANERRRGKPLPVLHFGAWGGQCRQVPERQRVATFSVNLSLSRGHLSCGAHNRSGQSKSKFYDNHLHISNVLVTFVH